MISTTPFWLRNLAVAVAVGVTAALAAPSRAEQAFRYDASNVDTLAHWTARSTLANAVMFSGLGEPLSIPMSTADDVLMHAGYVARPPMPDMAIVGAVYSAGEPGFMETPDFSDLRTLRWDPETFDRTLEPAAQAWTLIKITSPEFHLNFHDERADRRIALMMLPQAQAQARVLETLLTERGLFAARRSDGSFSEPRAGDQAVVLWSAANLILAATSERGDYWHKAYRALLDADDYRKLAARARSAIEALPPASPADRALAIEALGRYALATTDGERRGRALTLARTHADALRQLEDASLSDAALAVYGLTEAGRLLADDPYAKAAGALFRRALLPKWDDWLGAFATDGAIAYTPATVAAVVAALNAMRWHGPDDLVQQQTTQLYPRFLETVLVRAGLLLSSPLPLIPVEYRQDRPDAAFAHPALPPPEDVGTAPVFAGEVVHEQGSWRVSDRRFRTAAAMFLATMLAMPRDGRADPFLPADRLSGLER